MPRRGKRGGFTNVKRGKFHNKVGGDGAGFAFGRPPSSDRSQACAFSESEDGDSDSSNATDEFSAALSNTSCLSDSESESEGSNVSEVSNESLEFNGEETLQSDVVVSTENLLRSVLPNHWTLISHKDSFSCLKMSFGDEPAFQRNVHVTHSGTLRITVHRKELSAELLKELTPSWPIGLRLTSHSSKHFVDSVLRVVLAVRSHEMCAGVDLQKYEDMWASDETGVIDNNPYDEERYTKTFRSLKCSLLVPVEYWSCSECKLACDRFRRRYKHFCEEVAHPFTRNDQLTEQQKDQKLNSQRSALKNAKRQLDYYKSVNLELQNNGLNIDDQLGYYLSELVRQEKLSPIMHLFLQQQLKSATLKDSRGMRWHPAMIRFALLIKSTSSAALDAIRQSGMISIPGDRTLFDYSHAVPREEGLFVSKLNVISSKVAEFSESHKKFHNLLMDEIHICQKLVYRKSDGRLVGYVKLNEAEAELKQLEVAIQNSTVSQPDVATCVLAFMLKGVSNSVKEVIAAYPSAAMKKEFLFDRVWEVIPACERRGISILALVSDGCAVNRAFIAMHTPATNSDIHPGLVFDTKNPCAPDRNLYFIADPPHLLKTIRNNFAKSGQSKKCTRLLTKNGEFIVWKTIEKLYLEDVRLTLRRCPKLNSQNIYLNGYTCMKVSYAAQVMSNSVAQDLKSRNWEKTSETCTFIKNVNDFFDNVNGAHSYQGKRTANHRLEPYTSLDDARFDELLQFEKYLLDWEKEVELNDKIPKGSKGKAIISYQTLEGVYITVNAFIGAVKYLLKGTELKFINARVFCQDPLEQYFGKQRASGGGSHHPTVDAFQSNDIKISIHRDMSVRKRSSNTQGPASHIDISDERPAKLLRKKK
ncbi:Transposable element P transposase [Frankliniella fusca]|uniref:Transposable element P transposase n=1 Tax=Frankliniella fusca TaxID=407009 RepID=A0AAE1LIM7_9NEOP|nr:Transposable element P transposase [Frankliniella fusca]